VVFFAPPEFHQSILDFCQVQPDERVDSAHVVTWLLEQTCRAYEQLHPLYLSQGFDVCHRKEAQWKYNGVLTSKKPRDACLQVIQASERSSLDDLYGGLADNDTYLDN
jgi:hypothetical protein